jgi:transposase-like protein
MATMTVEGLPVVQETEVMAKARRRRFTAAEKLRILREADGCTKSGELGALLRREGLYSSHLATWRAARKNGELAGLTPRARGPKAKPVDPRDKKLVEQAREIARLQARLDRAEGLIELQKKVAQLLGTPLANDEQR